VGDGLAVFNNCSNGESSSATQGLQLPAWIRISVARWNRTAPRRAMKEVLRKRDAQMMRPVFGGTIAAISTPAGEGAIALIRIAGPELPRGRSRFFAETKASEFPSHVQHFGEIVEADRVIDQGNAVGSPRAAQLYRRRCGRDILSWRDRGQREGAGSLPNEWCATGASRPNSPSALSQRKMDLTPAESRDGFESARKPISRFAPRPSN